MAPPCPGSARPHMIHGVLQVEDTILDGVTDVILRVHHRSRHLFIGTALSQLLVLWKQTRSQKTILHLVPSLTSGLRLPILPHLNKDLPFELVGRRKSISSNVHRFGKEDVAKHLFEVLSHVSLLGNAAVVLDGQDDRVSEGQGLCTVTLTLPSSRPDVSPNSSSQSG